MVKVATITSKSSIANNFGRRVEHGPQTTTIFTQIVVAARHCFRSHSWHEPSSIRNGILIECLHPLLLASANCSIFPYLSQYHEQPATILRHQTRNHNPTRRNYCRHKTVARQPGDFFYRPSSSKLYSGDSRSRLGSSRTTTLNSLSSKMILTFLSSARSHLVLHTWLPRLSSL
jgi:hypothetical protein